MCQWLWVWLWITACHENVHAFSVSQSSSTGASSSSPPSCKDGNVLILDHLNMNHECGRHDWLKAFYFDFLQCEVDPRKAENLAKGRKTLWANIGSSHQFHLPEGKPSAQVVNGVITLTLRDLAPLEQRYNQIQPMLDQSKFSMTLNDDVGDEYHVVDPWGTRFVLKQSSDPDDDEGIQDLTLFVPVGTNLDGIARFYAQTLSTPAKRTTTSSVVVQVGPNQTLTFQEHSDCSKNDNHVDLKMEEEDGKYPSNYGIHVSMYIKDIRQTYRNAQELGVTYVNPRFKRRAYNEEEVVDDCMFRILDIVDPESPEIGPIVQLEHEIRSVIRRDGTKYKSCPLDPIPSGCII